MIEIRAYAADFVDLLAAENAPNRGFRRFAARFIRSNQNRGHDKSEPHHLEFGDRRTAQLRIAGQAAPDCRNRKRR